MGDEFVFGKIRKLAGEISMDEVNVVIESFPFLEPMPDRKGVNPMTNEEVIFSGKGKALYLEHGKRAGNISLQEGALLTTGVPESRCEELAKKLGAVVEKDDRS